MNTDGENIRPLLETAASWGGIPLELLVAGVDAESGFNPKAERWGTMTAAAKWCMEIGNRAGLQSIIDQVKPDISFGYSQKIVRWHWAGNGTYTVENCLAVREAVFSDPARTLQEMAAHLRGCLTWVEGMSPSRLVPVDGDPLLGALVIYNAGELPYAGESWWQRWAGNVASYRLALARARELVGAGG